MTQSNAGTANQLLSVGGVFIALAVPLLYSLVIGPLFVQPITTPAVYAGLGFAVYWALAACLLVLTRFGEGRPLASMGFKRLSWRMGALAVGLGVVLSLAVPLLTLLASQVLPVVESGGVTDMASHYPAGVILLSILTAGITEEVLFRGYAIERLSQLTGNLWLSGAISLLAFVLTHLSGWNLVHILGVVFPLGVIMTGLYLWQRNLGFLIIVHVLVDLPLFFIALGS